MNLETLIPSSGIKKKKTRLYKWSLIVYSENTHRHLQLLVALHLHRQSVFQRYSDKSRPWFITLCYDWQGSMNDILTVQSQTTLNSYKPIVYKELWQSAVIRVVESNAQNTDSVHAKCPFMGMLPILKIGSSCLGK